MRYLLALLIIALPAISYGRTAQTKGYIKKNGTYVAPSQKTSSNRTKLDNYSTKGNVNPYTGAKGTKAIYK